MSRVTASSWMIPAAATALIILGTTTGGQKPQPPNQDTLGALLVEVRGLRSAIVPDAGARFDVRDRLLKSTPLVLLC